MAEQINHPAHHGGADNPHETIDTRGFAALEGPMPAERPPEGAKGGTRPPAARYRGSSCLPDLAPPASRGRFLAASRSAILRRP